LTSLQQRLMKTGGPLREHAYYSWLVLAESHLTRRPFAEQPDLRGSNQLICKPRPRLELTFAQGSRVRIYLNRGSEMILAMQR
jgi:hypothetical protein